MTPKLKQYYAKLKIDSRDMESLLSDQAEQHGEICRQYVISKSKRDRLELEMQQEFDRLCGVMRRRLKKSEGKAVTETAVKQAVNALDSYQELQDEWLDLKEETRHWDLLREPSKQRSFMIGDLVELHINGMLAKRESSKAEPYDSKRERSAERRRNRE